MFELKIVLGLINAMYLLPLFILLLLAILAVLVVYDIVRYLWSRLF